MLLNILNFLISLFIVAFFTLAERKIMAAVQRRQGPMVVGFKGILQPIADGLKLVLKELFIPAHTSEKLFFFPACFLIFFSLVNWLFIPINFDDLLYNNYYNVLIIYIISSINTYCIIFAGWVSQSKYAFFGAVRAASQMISYDVSIGSVLLIIILMNESIYFSDIINNQVLFLPNACIIPIIAVIFFISIIAETNRAPFDLPEAEAELVAGYNVEYSSLFFAFFFLAEYNNILSMIILFTILFFGSLSVFFFIIKILIFSFLFVIVRASLPRYRYDQLISISWKIFFPFNFLFLIILCIFLI